MENYFINSLNESELFQLKNFNISTKLPIEETIEIEYDDSYLDEENFEINEYESKIYESWNDYYDFDFYRKSNTDLSNRKYVKDILLKEKYIPIVNYENISSKNGIYVIINLVNRKKYVGKSNRLHIRIGQHFNSLRKNKHYNKYLQYSFNKYGDNNFRIFLLEECAEYDLYTRENYWMNKLNTVDNNYGYNLIGVDENGKGIISDDNLRRRKELSSKTIYFIKDIDDNIFVTRILEDFCYENNIRYSSLKNTFLKSDIELNERYSHGGFSIIEMFHVDDPILPLINSTEGHQIILKEYYTKFNNLLVLKEEKYKKDKNETFIIVDWRGIFYSTHSIIKFANEHKLQDSYLKNTFRNYHYKDNNCNHSGGFKVIDILEGYFKFDLETDFDKYHYEKEQFLKYCEDNFINKDYIVLQPDNTFIRLKTVAKFCENNNISIHLLLKTYLNKDSIVHTKGYKIIDRISKHIIIDNLYKMYENYEEKMSNIISQIKQHNVSIKEKKYNELYKNKKFIFESKSGQKFETYSIVELSNFINCKTGELYITLELNKSNTNGIYRNSLRLIEIENLTEKLDQTFLDKHFNEICTLIKQIEKEDNIVIIRDGISHIIRESSFDFSNKFFIIQTKCNKIFGIIDIEKFLDYTKCDRGDLIYNFRRLSEGKDLYENGYKLINVDDLKIDDVETDYKNIVDEINKSKVQKNNFNVKIVNKDYSFETIIHISEIRNFEKKYDIKGGELKCKYKKGETNFCKTYRIKEYIELN